MNDYAIAAENGREAALLSSFRRALPPVQRAIVTALLRVVEEGWSFEDAFTECGIECGLSPRQARKRVRRAMDNCRDDPGGWRRALI